MAAEAEEEVRLEVEAVAAVYGEDCRVYCDFPPHLVVHVRPNTADDSSQQFVELFLGIKASSQYPKEPPHVYAVESKGLDENRQAYLISSIQDKAKEHSYYPMLVILCEGIAIIEVDREEFRWISDTPKGQPGTLEARVYPIQPE
ncbi:unnamed protein product [Triticum turgidum subsp. durum]|uniref:RWD domain-containing protein n=1 Tax=Triticum turgidum subsp. durum TaxID=4567 RepID=A0A9R0T3D4_TRITD|nr:unnamed protein product [Triticum turgidum subsp. durum]